MREAKIIVYGEPVPKARPRVMIGYTYTPEKTRQQEQNIGMVYKAKYRGEKFDEGKPIKMVADFYMRMPKRTSKKKIQAMESKKIRPTVKPDVDNLSKTVLDSLMNIAYKDDNQIVEIVGRKFYSETPRTEIYIAEINTDEE